MPYIDRDGVKIHYETAGSGPALLLSHGYSASTRMWEGQVAAFSPNYQVITWDMRGHADSDSPDDESLYSEKLTVDDMAAILKECDASTAIVAGLSLGGYMSLAFYLHHPEMVRALMLFDTGPGYKNPVAREGWNETSRKRAENLEEKGLA